MKSPIGSPRAKEATASRATVRRSWLRPYLAEARAELLRMQRTPAFVLPCLVFPVGFYLLFGVLIGDGDAASYLLATYCVFGAMGPALFGFGVQLAFDRQQGMFALRRALPVPPLAPLVARLLMAVLFALGVAGLLMLAGHFIADVDLTLPHVLILFGVAAFAALPIGAIGLLVGANSSADASTAIVNVVYLPMALLSGLWLPLEQMPEIFTTLAPLWPTWHAAQLAMPTVGLDGGNPWVHAAAMLAVTGVFTVLAMRRLRRVG